MSTGLMKRTYNRTGGWDAKHTHTDGVSYWRHGVLHCSDSFAVDRDGKKEVWLFGKHIPTPETADAVPLTFIGQSKTGYLRWVDDDGAIRATSHLNPHENLETRWFDRDGNPEAHHRGGYHVRVHHDNGEVRYYKQPNLNTAPLLHRLDGAAIEFPESPRKSQWLEDGFQVDGPIQLLIRFQKHRREHGRANAFDFSVPELTEKEQGRLKLTVLRHPDSEVALDISLSYTEPYIEAVSILDPDLPEIVFVDFGGEEADPLFVPMDDAV